MSFHGFQGLPTAPGVTPVAGSGVFEPASRPTLTEQLAIVNQALTAEVLRHAETRVKLRRMAARCGLLQSEGEEDYA